MFVRICFLHSLVSSGINSQTSQVSPTTLIRENTTLSSSPPLSFVAAENKSRLCNGDDYNFDHTGRYCRNKSAKWPFWILSSPTVDSEYEYLYHTLPFQFLLGPSSVNYLWVAIDLVFVWRRANTKHSFRIFLRWQFDPYQLICYQSFKLSI